jgi:hypothetical protein
MRPPTSWGVGRQARRGAGRGSLGGVGAGRNFESKRIMGASRVDGRAAAPGLRP